MYIYIYNIYIYIIYIYIYIYIYICIYTYIYIFIYIYILYIYIIIIYIYYNHIYIYYIYISWIYQNINLLLRWFQSILTMVLNFILSGLNHFSTAGFYKLCNFLNIRQECLKISKKTLEVFYKKSCS